MLIMRVNVLHSTVLGCDNRHRASRSSSPDLQIVGDHVRLYPLSAPRRTRALADLTATRTADPGTAAVAPAVDEALDGGAVRWGTEVKLPRGGARGR